jgi:hypothetical protein
MPNVYLVCFIDMGYCPRGVGKITLLLSAHFRYFLIAIKRKNSGN